MTDQEKYNIEVRVETAYVERESMPAQNKYVFTYTITIRNSGLIGAKLMSRHWFISNQDGKTYEMQGEGVVGEQPYLAVDQVYQYSSGAVLDTPCGTMQGAYQLIADDGQMFEAEISPFALTVPQRLH